uniref:PDZ domain-containing protein n=1 Tax=Panagrolaimus sp. ES5 TaxID=591445 RepID=A0AC34GN74_9BILA
MATKPKGKPGRTLDVVHSGMVLLSDGKGHGKPARLILTKEVLTIQMPSGEDDIVAGIGSGIIATGATTGAGGGGTVDAFDGSVRIVTVEKGKEGLGLSIKGGAEGGGSVNQNTAAPVVISKVIPGLPAAQTGQLFVGDKILEVNGSSVYGLSHEEVVRLLRDAPGANVVLVVQQSTMAPLFRRSPSKRRSTSFADSFDVRIVTVEKGKEGLGLSIKGGAEGGGSVNQNTAAPVVISKVIPGLPAAQTGQLFVGDKILEVNGSSVYGLSHEEVVRLLRDAPGANVVLVVQQSTMAPLFRRSPSKRRSTSFADSFDGGSVMKGALKSPSVDRYSRYSSLAKDDDLKSNAWKTVIRLPLPMAIVTRYLWGTDKIRSNAFELRTVDGKKSGIIHCEDHKALEQWVKHCEHHIEQLNRKSIKMSNKYLHPSEHITYIGWVEERMADGYFDDPKLKWEQRFLILKGSDLCVFETPPLNSEELDRCICMYKIYETVLRTAVKKRDRRPHVFVVDSYLGNSHYFSVQSVHQLQSIESAYYNSVYKSVISVQTRTFACSFDGRPAGLVLDFKQGISLYDIPTKKYIWQYGFDEVVSSSDDGKMRLELIFKETTKLRESKETKEIECDQVLSVVYTLHSFYVTLMMGSDPEFLKASPLD